MEQIKILHTAEELLFDVAQWPSEVPRLLLKSAVKPWAVYSLVKEEWRRDKNQRFKTTISPVLFWLIVVIVPNFLLLDHYLRLLASQHPVFACAASQPWPVKLFVLAVILAWWPRSCSRLVLKRARKAADPDEIRRLFCTHCLVLAPASLLLFGTLALGAAFHEHARQMQGVLFWLFAISSLYGEVAIVCCELPASWFQRLDAVGGCLALGIMQALIVVTCGGILVVAGSGSLPPITGHVPPPVAVVLRR